MSKHELTEPYSHYYMDLHIHIGKDMEGKYVKITASNELTVDNIMVEASQRKGLGIVGVIDCLSPTVLDELELGLSKGDFTELSGGGLSYRGETTLILGAELEIVDEKSQGPIHVLCYLPTLADMKEFSDWCGKAIKNLSLSTQRIYVEAQTLQKRVKEAGGWFIPAHIFTPFKSVYGKGVNTFMEEVFDLSLVDAVELGLSSDTSMADLLPELASFPFITSSDAHSIPKIGREHQIIQAKAPTFSEIEKALKEKSDRKVIANCGLYPQLGKYYQSVCGVCFKSLKNEICPDHPNNRVIRGVYDRIIQLAEAQKGQLNACKMKGQRPPYRPHVPLEFIPGIGPKTIDKLITRFQSEMVIIHEAPLEDLAHYLNEKQLENLTSIRQQTVKITSGGGGIYGKITF
ncbi:endonuclease Q family protein [Salipaludibacillus agaradhaerens]|uniref:endonuclease Q family protein n=1 Tax=Salipaludibacillus agaradhaerens TaxID=76935 RepID=UPI0009981C8E|nr:endonuclease Q family protein [Salipaludibacillus agaradhaerens]